MHADPQALAREMIVETTHPTAGKVKAIGLPIKFSETPGGVRSAAPLIGPAHPRSAARTRLRRYRDRSDGGARRYSNASLNRERRDTMSQEILYEVKDGVGRITFNRPEARNAFTFAMYERLAEICQQARPIPPSECWC